MTKGVGRIMKFYNITLSKLHITSIHHQQNKTQEEKLDHI